jgi:hypothetical protein
MISPEYRLTPPEQQLTAQRTISDANLLKWGAQYDDLAKLVLTDSQIETIQLAHEAGDSGEPSVYLQNMWLDTDVVSVWKSLGHEGNRLTNGLKRNKVNNRRDLLVLGKNRVNDFRGFGILAVREAKAIVASKEFDIPWLSDTTPEFVAGFCQNLGQVTLGVIGLEGTQPGEGDPVRYIGEILPMTIQERQERVKPIDIRVDPLVIDTPAERITILPEVYAERFAAARRTIES